MAKKKKAGSENTVIKLLPSMLTVAGILVGVWQFNAEQDHQNRDAFRRNIWEKRLEVYEKLGGVTAGVVNSTADSVNFQKAVHEFNNLYWGVLPLIQDKKVEETLIRFNAEIRYFKRQESSVDELRQRGYKLMTACKTSLNESWDKLMEDE